MFNLDSTITNQSNQRVGLILSGCATTKIGLTGMCNRFCEAEDLLIIILFSSILHIRLSIYLFWSCQWGFHLGVLKSMVWPHLERNRRQNAQKKFLGQAQGIHMPNLRTKRSSAKLDIYFGLCSTYHTIGQFWLSTLSYIIKHAN
jgi:hypothetical protein